MNVIKYIGFTIIAAVLILTGVLIGKRTAVFPPVNNYTNIEDAEYQKRLAYEITSALDFVKSFDFEISYAEGVGTTTPNNRYYTGMGCVEDRLTMAVPSNIVYTINDKKYNNENISYDESFDLSTCMIDPKNITFIRPITAGYEVEVSIPNTHFTATYTFVYKNFELQEIYGSVSYYEQNPESDYESAGGSLDQYEKYLTYVKIRDRK